MSEFILAKKDGGESFKKNFIIYLRIKEPLLQQVPAEICEGCESYYTFRLMLVCVGQIDQQCQALQKSLITRMAMRSFSSLVAQLNEALTEAVTSIRFISFLKQILRKFSKLLIESSDPYAVCFRLLDRQTFLFVAFDVYVTLGVPFERRQIVKITSLQWMKSMIR
ncbi:hypothetical protein Cgig2_020571 [Carnegiea gigantea]|uniref:Uncharacterized protein n=1 Tax=Carnegiea gigantea TaxID=171969 RepID=A0A9Q1JNR1_9CARY|nr:hypothetical protein Cgig2_020571 [Carnegiea gigantea]